MTVRDTQRSKVYRAEAVMDKFKKPLPSVEDVEKYIANIMAMKRVRAAFPRARWWGRVSVGDGRGRRVACGGANGIKLPLWARNSWIVVHELSHTITIRELAGTGPAAHGWQFCSVYLKLVMWTHGREAHDALKASFKAARVKIRPPRKGKPLSPERKAQLIATLAAARETRAVKLGY
jgi:putative metallohydrolase (TIGR04338 family)